MKKMLLVCLIIFYSFCLASAVVSIDDLSKSVVYLSQQIDTTVTSGTGFIVKYKNKDYLVTAKHIADSLTETAEITLNLKNGKGTNISFRNLLQQSEIKGASWFNHPDSNIDIAVHPIVYSNKDIDIIAIPESIYQKKEISIKLLNTVYIFGFPLGLGIIDKISPIAKEAKVASRITTINASNIPKNNYYYLLDEALSKGYSGAPVFYIEDIISTDRTDNWPMKGDEKLHLLGLQSIVLSDATGGKISLVIPIMYLWDIFLSSDFKKYEKGLRK